ncbi:MAG: cell division protein FtsQ/DivIB [Bernardetiaceae bacterium]
MKKDNMLFAGLGLIVLLVALVDWIPVPKQSNYQIEIVGAEQNFLTESDVLRLLGQSPEKADADEAALSPIYTPKADLGQLEARVKANPFVGHCEVARDVRGQILVRIEENQPVARVLTANGGEGFYLTLQGKQLPLSKNFTPHTLLITGEGTQAMQAPDFWEQSEGKQVLQFLQYVHQDPLWAAQCAQVDVDQKGSWTMYPQVGQHRFELGNLENIEKKLHYLRHAFYQHILPRKGWGAYQVVSVRYEGQIVCR